MVLHIPSEEDIRNYESSHAAMNTAWKTACSGRISPAVIAYNEVKPGKLVKVEFVWSSEDSATEKAGIRELQKLSNRDGLVNTSDCYAEDYWIGVPANFQERFSSSWSSALKSIVDEQESDNGVSRGNFASRLKQAIEPYTKQLPADFPGMAPVLFSLAEFLRNVGEYAEHDEIFLRALNIIECSYRKNMKCHAAQLGKRLNELAKIYLLREDLKSAVSIKRRLEQSRNCSEFKSELRLNWEPFLDFYDRNSRVNEAIPFCNEEVEKLIADKAPLHEIAHFKQTAAEVFVHHKQFQQAIDLFEELLEFFLSKKLAISAHSYGRFSTYRRFLKEEGRDADLSRLAERLAPLKKAATTEVTPENSYGYVDRDGHWKIPQRFAWASDFENGVARVKLHEDPDREDRRSRLIDTNGDDLGIDKDYVYNVPLPDGYRFYARFKEEYFEGLAAVVAPESEAAKYGHGYPSNIGYANRAGEIVIPPRFSYAEPFQNGIAIIAVGGRMEAAGCVIDVRHAKYGLISHLGDYVINPEFKSLKFANEERRLLRFQRENSGGIIDCNGTILCDIEGCCDLYSLENGMISAEFTNGKYGYIDASGTLSIPPKFDFAFSFSDELALVRLDGKWGYIDKSGSFAIPAQFSEGHSFDNGIAIVGIDVNGVEKYGCIDKSGQFVLPPIYDDICQYFNDGVTKITLNNRVGLIDRNANVLCQPKYDQIEGFREGVGIFFQNGNVGILNTAGREILPAKFKMVSSFHEGLMAVAVWKGLSLKWGYINEASEFVIKPQFRSAERFCDGIALVESENNKFGYIDKTGKYVVTPQYDRGASFVDGFARVGKLIHNTMYCGVIDTRGKVIVPVEFEYVGELSDGLRFVAKRCNWFRANRH